MMSGSSPGHIGKSSDLFPEEDWNFIHDSSFENVLSSHTSSTATFPTESLASRIFGSQQSRSMINDPITMIIDVPPPIPEMKSYSPPTYPRHPPYQPSEPAKQKASHSRSYTITLPIPVKNIILRHFRNGSRNDMTKDKKALSKRKRTVYFCTPCESNQSETTGSTTTHLRDLPAHLWNQHLSELDQNEIVVLADWLCKPLPGSQAAQAIPSYPPELTLDYHALAHTNEPMTLREPSASFSPTLSDPNQYSDLDSDASVTVDTLQRHGSDEIQFLSYTSPTLQSSNLSPTSLSSFDSLPPSPPNIPTPIPHDLILMLKSIDPRRLNELRESAKMAWLMSWPHTEPRSDCKCQPVQVYVENTPQGRQLDFEIPCAKVLSAHLFLFVAEFLNRPTSSFELWIGQHQIDKRGTKEVLHYLQLVPHSRTDQLHVRLKVSEERLLGGTPNGEDGEQTESRSAHPLGNNTDNTAFDISSILHPPFDLSGFDPLSRAMYERKWFDILMQHLEVEEEEEQAEQSREETRTVASEESSLPVAAFTTQNFNNTVPLSPSSVMSTGETQKDVISSIRTDLATNLINKNYVNNETDVFDTNISSLHIPSNARQTSWVTGSSTSSDVNPHQLFSKGFQGDDLIQTEPAKDSVVTSSSILRSEGGSSSSSRRNSAAEGQVSSYREVRQKETATATIIIHRPPAESRVIPPESCLFLPPYPSPGIVLLRLMLNRAKWNWMMKEVVSVLTVQVHGLTESAVSIREDGSNKLYLNNHLCSLDVELPLPSLAEIVQKHRVPYDESSKINLLIEVGYENDPFFEMTVPFCLCGKTGKHSHQHHLHPIKAPEKEYAKIKPKELTPASASFHFSTGPSMTPPVRSREDRSHSLSLPVHTSSAVISDYSRVPSDYSRVPSFSKGEHDELIISSSAIRGWASLTHAIQSTLICLIQDRPRDFEYAQTLLGLDSVSYERPADIGRILSIIESKLQEKILHFIQKFENEFRDLIGRRTGRGQLFTEARERDQYEPPPPYIQSKDEGNSTLNNLPPFITGLHANLQQASDYLNTHSISGILFYIAFKLRDTNYQDHSLFLLAKALGGHSFQFLSRTRSLSESSLLMTKAANTRDFNTLNSVLQKGGKELCDMSAVYAVYMLCQNKSASDLNSTEEEIMENEIKCVKQVVHYSGEIALLAENPNTGTNAFYSACSNGKQQMIKVLHTEYSTTFIDGINVRLHSGWTPLTTCLKRACDNNRPGRARVKQEYIELATYLLMSRALNEKTLNTPTPRQNYAITYCLSLADNKLLELLLEQGANPNVNSLPYNPLHLAMDREDDGAIDAFNLLLKYHANVNARDEASNTPLIKAAYKGDIGMVERLLSLYHANPLLVNDAGKTAATRCLENKQYKVAEYLQQAEMIWRARGGPAPENEIPSAFLVGLSPEIGKNKFLTQEGKA